MGIFDFLQKKPQTTQAKGGFNRNFDITGTNFANEDGINRQDILAKIYAQSKPFDKTVKIDIIEFEYEGSPALKVFANDMQIGFIAAKAVNRFISKQNTFTQVNCLNTTMFYDKEKKDWTYSTSLSIQVNENIEVPPDSFIKNNTYKVKPTMVIHFKGSKVYHTDPSCNAIKNALHDENNITLKQATKLGLTKCKSC